MKKKLVALQPDIKMNIGCLETWVGNTEIRL